MAGTKSNRDGLQALQFAYNEDTGRLKVEGDSAPGGVQEVEIDAASDSIAISDGVNQVTTTNANGKQGLDVNVISDLALDISHTEDSIQLGDGTDLFTSSPKGNRVPLDVSIVGNLTTRIDETTTPNITYVGKAIAGTAEGTSAWQIFIIDESTSIFAITYASGNPNFVHAWNNRTGLTYS